VNENYLFQLYSNYTTFNYKNSARCRKENDSLEEMVPFNACYPKYYVPPVTFIKIAVKL
jgi:hypothetical protein